MKRTFAGWMCCIGLVAMLAGGTPAAGSASASAPNLAKISTTMGPRQGGDILLQAPTIQLTEGATISARSTGTGTVRSLRIREADTLLLNGTTMDVLPYSGGIGNAKLVAQGEAQLALSALPFHAAEASLDDQGDEEQAIPEDGESTLIPIQGEINASGEVDLIIRVYDQPEGGRLLYQLTKMVTVEDQIFADEIDVPSELLSATPQVFVGFASASAPEDEIGERMPFTPAVEIETVRPQEFPYNLRRRACNSYPSPSFKYKLDFCVSVGFIQHPGDVRRHVGQVTLACRTTPANRLVRCRTMTNNDARLLGCRGNSCVDLVRHWRDSVPNVSRYVSHTSSFDCLRSRYTGTKVRAFVTARFPDNTVPPPQG
jgi:hypothetical protein